MKHRRTKKNLPLKSKLLTTLLMINKVVNNLFYRVRFFFVLLFFIVAAQSFGQKFIPDRLDNRLLYLNTRNFCLTSFLSLCISYNIERPKIFSKA